MKDPHNYKRKLQNTVERVKNSDIPREDKEATLEFKDRCLLNVSVGRANRYTSIIEKLIRG